MTIGQKIKNLREDANMTQSELASLIRSTKQTIYKYETGIVTNIPLDKLKIIAATFDVSPAYLMGWTDNADPAAAESELDNYLVEKLTSLSPAEEEKVLAYIDGLIANRQD